LTIKLDPPFPAAAPAGWRARIEGAASPPAVVDLCIEFLSGWTPRECARLPDAMQPPMLMREAADVTDYALRLVQAECGGDTVTPEHHAMATFFAMASMRLSHLLANWGRVRAKR